MTNRRLPLIILFILPVWLGSQWLPSQPVVDTTVPDGPTMMVLSSDTAIVGLFKRECSSCHGVDGKGETRAGKRAGVKDFTDAAYQATWTDEEAFQVVSTATKDGKELRNKKPFAGKLTEEQIRLLVEHVRSFAANE